ncbi:chemotaxis protein CheW, partial [Pseudomonas sp. CrR25]|nr:chemotaxis protein CheW [Pseudomonas sp. CrR25]
MSEPVTDNQRWQRIRERLAQFEQRLASEFAIDIDTRDRRLQERARQWAASVEEEQSEGWLEVLSFNLGDETYAIESEHVAEVMPLAQFTPLPGTPPHVLGIVNVRGHIVSLV